MSGASNSCIISANRDRSYAVFKPNYVSPKFINKIGDYSASFQCSALERILDALRPPDRPMQSVWVCVTTLECGNERGG